MIERIAAWLKSIGVDFGVELDVDSALIAGGITLAIIVGGWVIGDKFAPYLRRFLDKRAGANEVRDNRLDHLLRYAFISLGLLILFNATSWPRLADSVIGIPLAITSTLFINRTMRVLRMPRWAAMLLSAAAFALIISRLLGGVDRMLTALDDIGFNAGGTRVSVLTVLTFLVTAVLLVAAVRLTNRVLGHAIQHQGSLDPAQKLLGQKLVGIAIATVAFFVGVDMLGIDLTALAVFSGAFGLAIGFGFQKTFGNLISGIILLMDRSIKPGDVIVVGDSFGWVNKIGIRAVSIITRDGKEHLIPNENLMTEEVENWSYSSKNVRIRIPVGVSYNSDMDQVEALMMRAAEESPRVLDTPKPNVWMEEYGDSSVNFEILAWIKDPEEGVGNVRSDVLKRLWKLFKEHDVEIPFPQRDLNLRNLPPKWIDTFAEAAGNKGAPDAKSD